MTPQGPSIRIIIPCRHADGTLEACLASVCGFPIPGSEIVVVDDGGNTTLDRLSAAYPISVVRSEGKGSAGAARNAGARGCNARVLVFLDADVAPERPETIALLASSILEGKAQASVGRYGTAARDTFAATYKQRYLAYTYGVRAGDLKNTFWSALCAVDRTTFEVIGGFKESYAGAGPEDIEFGISLTAHGFGIRAVPDAVGQHLKQFSLRGLMMNDLKKGTEDVFIHWSRRVAITENRHVGWADMLAVAFAILGLCLLVVSPFIGPIPSLCILGAYGMTRKKFLAGAFGGYGVGFALRSAAMTFVLDLVRGVATVLGTLLYGIHLSRRGRWSPFMTPNAAGTLHKS